MPKKFMVPVITSYYEYLEVEADTAEEAVEKVKLGQGDWDKSDMEYRETIAYGEDAGEVLEIRDERA